MIERHEVTIERLITGGVGAWGNQDEETYGSPTPERVFGWSSPTSVEPQMLSGDNRVIVTVQMLCAERVQLHPGDKVTLPYAPVGTFKVVGRPEEFNASPFSGWKAGKVVNLEEVSG